MEENSTQNKVFMPLDVNTYSFSGSTHGNTKGVVILTLFTIGYWFLAFSFLEMVMIIMDTLSKAKPLSLFITIYILIAQKIIRVFIVKEKERLAEFVEHSRNNITTLGEFYDIKSSGFETQKRINPKTGNEQLYHKVVYKDGTEEHIAKFSRGSITSEFSDTETAQVKLTCNFLNTLMTQGIIPKIVISDERIERAVVFKFYQDKLRCGKFEEEFVDMCNSTLLYHESNAEMYSRITANYYFVPAKTAKQKIFMENFVKTVGSNLNFSTFRDITLMNKSAILNMFKDLNCLNAINEHTLQTEEAKNRVPLGETMSLYVRNIITEEIREINTSESKMRINIQNIDYKILRKVDSVQNSNSIQKPLTDIEEEQAIEDLFNDVELPDFEDILNTSNDVSSISLNKVVDTENITLDSLKEVVDPYATEKFTDEVETLLDNGVFDFTALPSDKSTIEKSVLLLNTLQNEECTVIIL